MVAVIAHRRTAGYYNKVKTARLCPRSRKARGGIPFGGLGMRYVLGLDVGIASVGWAVVNLDRHRVEGLGVRGFSAAEDPKTKAPLAEPRRLQRSARRRLARRAERLRRAKDLFVEFGLLASSDRDTAFTTARHKPDPWQLRAEGLDRLLTGEELARALFHIAKHRGFKSNRIADRSKEEGRMLESIQRSRDPQFDDHKRSKADSYANSVERGMLEDDIRALFEARQAAGRLLRVRFAADAVPGCIRARVVQGRALPVRSPHKAPRDPAEARRALAFGAGSTHSHWRTMAIPAALPPRKKISS